MPTPDGTGPHASCTADELVSIERARQLHEKSHTVQGDEARHEVGQLAQRAACYEEHGTDPQPPPGWPGEFVWRPQRNQVSALVRAGALYQAEIDRLQHRLEKVIARIERARRRERT
jgi:hypothetical protein